MIGGGDQEDAGRPQKRLRLHGVFVGCSGVFLDLDDRFRHTKAERPPFHLTGFRRSGSTYSCVAAGEYHLRRQALEPQFRATSRAVS